MATWTPALVNGHSIGEAHGWYTEVEDRVLFHGILNFNANSYVDPIRITLPVQPVGTSPGGGTVYWNRIGRQDTVYVGNAVEGASEFLLYDRFGNAVREMDYNGEGFYFQGQYRK